VYPSKKLLLVYLLDLSLSFSFKTKFIDFIEQQKNIIFSFLPTDFNILTID